VSPSRQQRASELAALLDGRRRRRSRSRRRRGRAALVVAVLAICIPLGLVAAGFTTAEAFLASCSLSSLKPIDIGQTSFLYAADGSVLGSIPAQRHRQPVRLRAVSHWMQSATVAVEDRRF
jgi:membrane peptidoglycan carboxypeptidase